MNNLYAVELKQTITFSSYIQAESKEEAESLVRSRSEQMKPDSVVFESIAYQNQRCELCQEEHFGPACLAGTPLLRPSWERARL